MRGNQDAYIALRGETLLTATAGSLPLKASWASDDEDEENSTRVGQTACRTVYIVFNIHIHISIFLLEKPIYHRHHSDIKSDMSFFGPGSQGD